MIYVETVLFQVETFAKYFEQNLCFLRFAYFQKTNQITQRYIQNTVKHLRWSVLQKYLAAFTRYLFSQNAPP